ncbi:MAG: hypothetical protein H8F28_10275, partial [Fibrella sp.]|nr:hypothetical protein [Armatimonadota bacterium]
MRSLPARFASFAATALCAVAMTVTPAAYAQDLFLTSGSFAANDATYQNNVIFVGRDSDFAGTNGMGDPYIATLNVVSGGSVGNASAYNSSTINILGGGVVSVDAFDTSTLNISGGNMGDIETYGSSTLNISGGGVGI